MSLTQQQHAETGLADTTADGKGQLTVEQHLMEWQLTPVITASLGKLLVHALGVYADTHGGYFHRAVQHVVIEQYIAVELPVIIVGGASVVLFAV